MRSTWKPWHQVVQLRDDVKTGELSLAVVRRRPVRRGNAKG